MEKSWEVMDISQYASSLKEYINNSQGHLTVYGKRHVELKVVVWVKSADAVEGTGQVKTNN